MSIFEVLFLVLSGIILIWHYGFYVSNAYMYLDWFKAFNKPYEFSPFKNKWDFICGLIPLYFVVKFVIAGINGYKIWTFNEKKKEAINGQ